MRKLIALAVSAGLVAGAFALPAGAAAKKKTIKDSFTATAVPFPNLSSHTGTATPGCTAGQEGVHKVTTPFETPGKGRLIVETKDFTGDWDLYLFDPSGLVLAKSDSAQVPDGAPPVEKIVVDLKAMKTYDLVTCNWAGAPTTDVTLKYTYAPMKHKH